MEELVSCDPPYYRLRLASLPVIYDALRLLKLEAGSFRKVAAFVLHIVKARGQSPSPFLFETLIHVMVDTRCSAAALGTLLREMDELAVNKSSGLCEGALAVLAVHPDYTIRNDVIKYMKDAWLQPTQEGEENILLGQLRDGQYELAFDKLEALVEKGQTLSPFVYDIFIFAFAQLGFLDEAVKTAHFKLRDPRMTIPWNLWYYLLDTCSTSLHYPGVKYLWTRMVETQRLNPSDGMLNNVLNTAARHHDIDLATRVMQLMTERGARLQGHHFEALADCYVGREDIANVFQVLCIMAKAGVSVTEGSTRSIYNLLKMNPALADEAVETLIQLSQDNEVPTGALDVVIEAMVEAGRSDEALDLYRHARTVTKVGPGLRTVQLLLRDGSRPDIREFLEADQPGLIQRHDESLGEGVADDLDGRFAGGTGRAQSN